MQNRGEFQNWILLVLEGALSIVYSELNSKELEHVHTNTWDPKGNENQVFESVRAHSSGPAVIHGGT